MRLFIIIFFISFILVLSAKPACAIETLIKTPKIRVGLYSTDDWIQVTVNDDYKIKAGGAVIKELLADETAEIKYKKATKQYVLKYNEEKIFLGDYLRVVPNHKNKVITLVNYENHPAWNEELNDNEFLGKIELRYSENTDLTWVIEIVGLENYVKGVAEATNDSNSEYLKTLYTAARTYAYWHYTYPYRHDEEYYTLDTTANDQLYKGYNYTERAPNIAQAVLGTRGMVVTYNDELAITPYFSNSDGRTRSWDEVWAGDYPYLISVDDPGCKGMELNGHGVGLSAYGASYFAVNDGWKWKKILKYYYTGVKITPLYY